MTEPDPARLAEARQLLAPYGVALNTRDLADLLAYRSTRPILDMIRAGEFRAIERGREDEGSYSIPTESLIPWLARRLTPHTSTDAQEEK